MRDPWDHDLRDVETSFQAAVERTVNVTTECSGELTEAPAIPETYTFL